MDAEETTTGRVLLVSCYELGHQPLSIATAAARLRAHDLTLQVIDLSLESLDPARVRDADVVAISVPMHTALRIGVAAARSIRRHNPGCRIVFFGLYATLNAQYLTDHIADACLGAESDIALVETILRFLRGKAATDTTPDADRAFEENRARRRFVPDRSVLPALERYASLEYKGDRYPAGMVSSTRGCKHMCRHCPIPPVYNGRFYALHRDDVLADVAAIVRDGARHVTFGDADFLNGPSHAVRIAEALHDRFPAVTFDFTAKVEHLLRHADLLPRFRTLGCVFVITAAESLSDRTLLALHKRHSADDIVKVVQLFRDTGLALRPTFVPFTPWDTMEDYQRLLDFIEDEDLIDHVDPVQLGIRLLVPPGSLLETAEEIRPYLGAPNPEDFTHSWSHPDARMDDLQLRVASAAEEGAARFEDARVTFARIRRLVEHAVDPSVPAELDTLPVAVKDRVKPPRLTEDWFC